MRRDGEYCLRVSDQRDFETVISVGKAAWFQEMMRAAWHGCLRGVIKLGNFSTLGAFAEPVKEFNFMMEKGNNDNKRTGKSMAGYGNGYCPHCGAKREKNGDVCANCGKEYSLEKSMKGVPALGAAGIGWSPYVNAPSLKKQEKKTKRGLRIGMGIVSVIIAAVIMISSKMDFEDLLDGGYVTVLGPLVIIWVFWFLWMTINFRKKKGWEGEVINKDQKTYEDKRKDDEGNSWTESTTYYTVYFRDTAGKEHKFVQSRTGSWYDYLEVGDRVRYHGKYTNYYEKYDKSKLEEIPCAGCGARCDTRAKYCTSCGTILFKAEKPVKIQKPAVSSERVQERQKERQKEEAPVARFCEQCGTEFEPGARFCEKCGAKL